MASQMAGRPIYLRIADALREQIRDGTYQPGAKLPAERDLIDEWGVAGGTVRAALIQLRDEGLVISYQGRGVYVRERPKPRKVGADKSWLDILAREGKPDASQVTVRREPCPADVAADLGIDAGELVTVRERLLRAEGEPPTLISLSWHPEWTIKLLPELADPTKGGMLRAMEELGLRLHFRDVFASRRPTDDERDRLELAPGDVVTDQRGVTYDQDHRALYAIRHIAAGHRIEFAVAYGDLPPTT